MKTIINTVRQTFGIKINRRESLYLTHSTLINEKEKKHKQNSSKLPLEHIEMNFFQKLEQREIGRKLKSVVIPANTHKHDNAKDRVVFSRYINHREMPGSYHWCESTECYY